MFNPIILIHLSRFQIYRFFFIFFIIFLPLAQSWFETEKQTAETEGMATDDTPQETLQPSVPTGSDEDSRCQVCHDAFEQFYNEEKEEWHLRPAVNYEKRNYHPLCLEDYKVGFSLYSNRCLNFNCWYYISLIKFPFVAFLQK